MSDELKNSLTQAFRPVPEQAWDAAGPHLAALSGPLQGLVFPLAAGQATIGRKPFNSIILPSSGVSKTHCTLVREETAVFLIDNDSTNGTFVNGRQVAAQSRMQLVHGDVITIFDTTFLFLNPEKNEGPETLPELHVDFHRAAQEAEDLLRLASEAKQMRRARSR